MQRKTSQTDVNRRRLIAASSYDKVELEGINNEDLADALNDLFKKKGTNASRISTITGVTRSYINELQKNRRGHKNPSRKYIIAICLGAGASLEETDHVLKCARLKELYARDEMEALIIWALSHKKGYYDIIELLESHGYGDFLSLD